MAKRISLSLLVVVLLLGAAGFWLYRRPLPTLQAQVIYQPPAKTSAIKLPWPVYGQAAFGAVGFGILAANNASSPVPIASVAKTITALAILNEKPLQPGQEGPIITISAADVQSYKDYVAQNGSVVPVNLGEQISEYQALQAMLLPSANNIADTMARWAFGSIDNYVVYANRLTKNLGMIKTNIADASGFSPRTVSTAGDLVLAGEAALRNPVLAQIVDQSQADIPVAGNVKNVNLLLGTDGIIGIKTGDTDQAKGCFLFAAKRTVSGQSITVVGAILGAPARTIAMNDSRSLIQAADKGFEQVTVVGTNQPVGRYNLPWGGSADAVASSDIKILGWKGQSLAFSEHFDKFKPPIVQGRIVGSFEFGSSANNKSVRLILNQSIPKPSWTWRIFR